MKCSAVRRRRSIFRNGPKLAESPATGANLYRAEGLAAGAREPMAVGLHYPMNAVVFEREQETTGDRLGDIQVQMCRIAGVEWAKHSFNLLTATAPGKAPEIPSPIPILKSVATHIGRGEL